MDAMKADLKRLTGKLRALDAAIEGMMMDRDKLSIQVGSLEFEIDQIVNTPPTRDLTLDLPPEIMYIVFSYAPCTLMACALVNKRWRQLSRDAMAHIDKWVAYSKNWGHPRIVELQAKPSDVCVVGDSVYVLTQTGSVHCVGEREPKARWVTAMCSRNSYLHMAHTQGKAAFITTLVGNKVTGIENDLPGPITSMTVDSTGQVYYAISRAVYKMGTREMFQPIEYIKTLGTVGTVVMVLSSTSAMAYDKGRVVRFRRRNYHSMSCNDECVALLSHDVHVYTPWGDLLYQFDGSDPIDSVCLSWNNELWVKTERTLAKTDYGKNTHPMEPGDISVEIRNTERAYAIVRTNNHLHVVSDKFINVY